MGMLIAAVVCFTFGVFVLCAGIGWVYALALFCFGLVSLIVFGYRVAEKWSNIKKPSWGKNGDPEKDASHVAAQLKKDVTTAAVGDTIEAGFYPQTGTGATPEPIEWRVLAKEGGRVLLVSVYALDVRKSSEYFFREVTWEKSDLKKWLCRSFAYRSDLHKADVELTLLSAEEVARYFRSMDDASCRPTCYTAEQGIARGSGGTCRWWLRSSVEGEDARDRIFGDFLAMKGCVKTTACAVRPAMWVNL